MINYIHRNDIKRSCSSADQPIIINFSRGMLSQTGSGHFSPVGAYNEQHDMVLILDTARFKLPAFWTKLPLLWESIQAEAFAQKHGIKGKHL